MAPVIFYRRKAHGPWYSRQVWAPGWNPGQISIPKHWPWSMAKASYNVTSNTWLHRRISAGSGEYPSFCRPGTRGSGKEQRLGQHRSFQWWNGCCAWKQVADWKRRVTSPKTDPIVILNADILTDLNLAGYAPISPGAWSPGHLAVTDRVSSAIFYSTNVSVYAAGRTKKNRRAKGRTAKPQLSADCISFLQVIQTDDGRRQNFRWWMST